MDKDLIEDQFNKDKITPEIYQFYDGNGRTPEALFANDETKKLKWIFIVLNTQSLQKIYVKTSLYSRCIDCNLKKN